MARVKPILREDAPELKMFLAAQSKPLGLCPIVFLPWHGCLVCALLRLAREVIGVPGKVPLSLKRMVGYMASRSAGCMYCSSHTAETASVVDGVPPEKVAAIWEYETSNLFDEAERAALRMAQGAGVSQ